LAVFATQESVDKKKEKQEERGRRPGRRKNAGRLKQTTENVRWKFARVRSEWTSAPPWIF
jgi:hypothetical protein